MLFSSMTFIFVFLPLLLLIYYLSFKKWHNGILLFASIIFYAWGEPRYLFVMISIVVINYLGAWTIEKYQESKRILLSLSLLIDFAVLFYFKYAGFVLDNINLFLQEKISGFKVVLPIGISFYIFQAVSYIVDVYREDQKAQKNFWKLFLYIVLFPQLIAGPILKYHDMASQIDMRAESFAHFVYGVKRFIIGLSKKVLLANTVGAIADIIFEMNPNEISCLTAWLGAFSYTFQLYYDFSGYSDMAIGLGAMFGFRIPENFNYPYISKSITEFWRRWHISLSTWFKEYLYIPLGGNRISKSRTLINLAIVFIATGIWHGASWNFIIWGIWNGGFIILERIVGLNTKTMNSCKSFLMHIYTIIIFVIGWVIFRAVNIKYALMYIRSMFNFTIKNFVLFHWEYYINNIEILAFIVSVFCSIPLFRNMVSYSENYNVEIDITGKIHNSMCNIFLLFLFIISSMSIASSTYNPFIYFRF